MKSKMVAGLLAIFTGSVGGQYFYLGHTKKGIIFAAVALLTCGIGAAVTQIIGYIDAYKIFTDPTFTDANGNTLEQ